jgi:two-component system sensor histidine kinase BaeS
VKVTLGTRLFLTVLAAFLGVAAAGLTLVRWRVSEPGAQTSPGDEQLLARLGEQVSLQYRAHGDWSFLPADPEHRRRWLSDQVAALRALPASGDAASPTSPGLDHRIGLLDRDRHVVAGVTPARLLVAVASIDTFAHALKVDGRVIGTLVEARAESVDNDLAVAFLVEQQRHLALLAAIGLLLAVAASALLAAHFRRPILQLVDGARALGAGRFETRLLMRRTDELGELARTFDRLAEQLEAAERSRRDWVADTSHELRTPLAVVRAQLEALQDGVRPASPDHIALVLRQVVALGKVIDDLRVLAQSDVGRLVFTSAEVAAWPLVEEVAVAFEERLRRAGLALELGPPPADDRVHADADRLRQVISNLLENAIRYTDAGGRIEIRAVPAGAALHLRIDDSAPGVPVADLPRLGERFFRVDASRSRERGGTGLGLALSRGIVEAQGGRLEFAASPLGGLRAVVVLPLEHGETGTPR